MKITSKDFFVEGKKYIELDLIKADYLTMNHIDIWSVKNGTLVNKEGEEITDNYKLSDILFWEFIKLKDRLFYDTENGYLITIKSLELEYNEIELDTKNEIGSFENYIKNCTCKNGTLIEIK